MATTLDPRSRSSLLLAAALLACNRHPDEPGATSSGSTVTATSDVPTTGALPEACVPDPDNLEGILCLPKTTATCGPCDATCQASSQAVALVDTIDVDRICCTWELEPVCGPLEFAGKCCYTVQISTCYCLDAAPPAL